MRAIELYIRGGPFMYFIALVLLVGGAIILERMLVLFRSGTHGRRLYARTRDLVLRHDIDKAVALCERYQPAVLARVIRTGLRRNAGHLACKYLIQFGNFE